MADLTLLGASIAYAIAATAYYLAVARRVRAPETLRIARIALLSALVLHFMEIVHESLKVHRCPVTSTHFAVSLTGLVTVVMFLGLASRVRIESLGALVALLGLVSFVSAQFMHQSTAPLQPTRVWLAIHITSNMIGVGLFMLSAGVGAAYLAQARRLKAKRADAGHRQLPGLLPLEILMRRLLLVGFIPLSLGVITGSMFANRIHLGGIEAMRVGLSYGVWLLVGVIIIGGPVGGWRGRKIAWGNILGALASIVVVVLYVLTPTITGGP